MKKTLPLAFARRLALVALPLLLAACIVDPGPRYGDDQGYVSGGGYYDDGYGYDDGYYGPRSYPPAYVQGYYNPSYYYYSDPYYGRVYYGPSWYGPGYYYGAGGTVVYYRDRDSHHHHYRGTEGDWSRAYQRNQNQNDDRWQQQAPRSSGDYREGYDRRGDDNDRPRSSRPPASAPQAPRNGGFVDDAARKLVKPQPAPRSSPAPQREAPAPARPERPAKDKSAGQLWKDRGQHGD